MKFFTTCLLICLLTAPLAAFELTKLNAPNRDLLTWQYPKEEVEYLSELPLPEETFSLEDLYQLSSEVSQWIQASDLSGIDATILPAYLASAQKDFAYLSYLLTGDYRGDLAPVTLWILQLFEPSATLPSAAQFDLYSSSLAAIVVGKAARRLLEERAQLRDYPVQTGSDKWEPTSPGYRGLKFGSAKTWFLTSSSEHLAVAPEESREYWKEQARQIKEAQSQSSGDQKQSVFEWASLTSMKAGRWDAILDTYLKERNIPLIQQLYARAFLACALLDSNAASFNSKYTYWVKRPSQADPDVEPMITIPNHPSYPSAHSTIAGTAVIVLTELFPQDKEKWEELAEEAGMSRIYGGIHYPVDHEAGMKLGTEVGKTILQRSGR